MSKPEMMDKRSIIRPLHRDHVLAPWLCPACQKSGFMCGKAALDARPLFHCQRCDHQWTSGKDGRPYIGDEQGLLK